MSRATVYPTPQPILDTRYVQLIGGTLTGKLTINQTTTNTDALDIVIDESTGSKSGLYVKDNNNWAVTTGLSLMELVNGTDSGYVLKLKNAGTGDGLQVTNASNVISSRLSNAGAFFNQTNANYDFKVAGTGSQMVWVRSGFDRVGFGVASVDYFFHVGNGDIKLEGTVKGITIDGDDVNIAQTTGGKAFKVGGNSLPGMIWVRSGFDRVGFGFSNSGATIDNPFDVNLDSKFRTVIAIGDAATDSGKILNIDKTLTDTSGDKYGFFAVNRANMGSDTGQTIFGGFIEAQTKSGNSHNYSSGLRGAKVFAEHNGTGTVTNAFGAEYQVVNTSTGVITTAVGMNILGNTNSGGGTITTNIGIQIGDQNTGGTNFAIYTGAGVVRFGDLVDLSGIAAGSPNIKINATSDTPSTTWTGGVPSNNPAGFMEINVGGNSRYVPYWS